VAPATDLAGNALASDYVWVFVPTIVPDVTAPTVTLTFPATTVPGPTAGPAINVAITATFSESMDPATIDTLSFTVVDTTSGGTAVPGSVTYVVSSKIARFKPTADFAAGDTYTATIAGTGLAPVTDLAGNALAGNTAALPAASDYVWTFQPTALPDVTAPTITLEFPADGDIDVALNSSVNATFDEAMDAATIDIASFTLEPTASPGAFETGVVTYDAVNNIATFKPSSNLAGSTQYTATVTTAATDLAGNALDDLGGLPDPWIFTTANAGLAPGAIALGSASTFGIMATSAITCVPVCTINGDVSLDPGTSLTGPPVVNGSIHINDTVSAQAKLDLLAAYNEAKGLPPGTGVNALSAGADLGALFPGGVPPGTYTSGSTIIIDTATVLDAGGNANAVWVFQIGSSLTANQSVTLLNGAQAKNVFWVPTSAATIGVGTIFNGTILAGGDVTAVSGSTINGRILAGAIGAGTIALQAGTTVNVPAP
jgi:hypothetical protein